jgi:hypothetical protein
MTIIKSDIARIAKFLLSDRITFRGDEYPALHKMLETLNEMADMVPTQLRDVDDGSHSAES